MTQSPSGRKVMGAVGRLCRVFRIRGLVSFLLRNLERCMLFLLFPFAWFAVVAYSAIKGRKFLFAGIDFVNHLGSWATTLDAFLRRVGDKPEHIEYVFIIPGKRIANSFFYELMQRQVTVIESPFPGFLLLPLARIPNPLRVAEDKVTQLLPEEVGRYRSIAWFSEQDHLRGSALLEQLGIRGKDAWYVCFFARDNAYDEAHYSGSDIDYYRTYHSNRNSDIDAYIRAMKFIIDRGGYVIRVGKIVNKPVGFSHPRLIDYPFNPYRSDFADIYLICHCKFIIGCGSGVVDVATIVDMPTGWVNSPFYSIFLMGRKNTIFIPKLMRSRSTGKYISLREYRQRYSRLNGKELVDEMRRNDIVHEDNSEEDILLVTSEMYDRCVSGGNECWARADIIDGAGFDRSYGIWPGFLERHPELLQ